MVIKTPSSVRPFSRVLLIILGGSASHVLATEDCNVKKVGEAMFLESGGIAQDALSEDDYEQILDLHSVRVTTSGSAAHPDGSRLTVVIDEKGKVRHVYCQ